MTKARTAMAVMALLLVGVGPSSRAAAVSGEPVHLGRAFTARAEAYPMESAPGTRDTEVPVRPAATRAVASNPPVDAFARAAAADLGLAEAYLGQQGPSADADTATEDGDDDVVVDDGSSHMEAHVDGSPRASANATGSAAGGDPGSSGTVASASAADGAGARLVASAEAEVHDLAIGLLILGSGRFEARAEIDGTPGGGRAEGFIRTSDATFAGIPITLGAEGVQVDESRVPDPLLRSATAAIQEAFAPGGYADIRVVQPTVEVAEDGTSARVYGGSVRLYLTNNDPAERYFFSYTLLGGTAEVVLGGALSQPTPDRLPTVVTVPAPPPAALDTATVPAVVSTPTADSAGSAGSPATPTPELAFVAGTERVSLRVPWPGWVWVLVLVAGAWATAGALRLPPLAPTKHRLDSLVNDVADRYLRG